VDTTPESLEPAHRDKITPFSLFLLIVVASVAALYATLFTPFGNSKLTPWIEKKLSDTLGNPLHVTTFVLTLDTFELNAIDTHSNLLQTSGEYNLFPPSIDGRYHLCFPTTFNILKTPLETNGTLKGAYHKLLLDGNGALFNGQIDYNATLSFLKLRTFGTVIHHLDYQSLMDYLEYPHQSNTTIDGNLIVSGIHKRNIVANGTIIAHTEHFKPSTLMPDDNESFDFWALLADKNGKIAPFKINADINASMNELGMLEQFVSYPLRTGATAHLSVQGSEHQLNVNVDAQAARGNTHATLELIKLKPKHLIVDAKKMDASSLFALLCLPPPLEATLSGTLDSNFTDTSLTLDIAKAQTNPAVLKQHYHITQPLIHFNSTVKMKITPNSTYTSGTFKSDLEDLRFEGSPTHDAMLRELLNQIKDNKRK
jgi:hypothetical protein